MARTSRNICGSTRHRIRSFMAQPYKHPLSGVFYLRRRVPDELRESLGHEYKRSLKTRDPSEARARFAAEWIKSEEAFALARAQLNGTCSLSALDAQQLAARWFRSALDEMERTGDFTPLLAQGDGVGFETDYGYEEYQPWLSIRQAIEAGDETSLTDHAIPILKASLRNENIPLPGPDSAAYRHLLAAFTNHLVQLSDIAKTRHDGDWSTQPSVLPIAALSIRPAPKARSLLETFEDYSSAKLLDDGDNRSTRKTLDEYRTTIRRYVELFGDSRITAISRSDIQNYRAKLSELPVKTGGASQLTAPQLIAKADAEQLTRLSAATVRNKLKALSAVLGYAVRMGWIQENPVEASGIAKAAGRSARKAPARRKDYSAKELTAIFTSPLFTKEGWQPPRRDFGKALYWLPLLMYYTGARREELAQLAARDVSKDEAGIPYLSILSTADDDDGGRTVKTASSRRLVPVHNDLVSLGLLEYAQSVPGNGQLFPKLKPTPSGYYGINWGKAWAGYLRDVVQLDSPASPAHGFRHTFKTLCRASGIPEDVHDSITGHSNGSISRDYGSMPLSRLAQELAKLPSCPAVCTSQQES